MDTDAEFAVILDLDGTLVDSVYQHVSAWQRALSDLGVTVPAWRLHSLIGMSGDLLLEAVSRQVEVTLSETDRQQAEDSHSRYFLGMLETVDPLPGAIELFQVLQRAEARWTIATSGGVKEAEALLHVLGQEAEGVPLLSGDDVARAKPNPQLLTVAVERLGSDAMITWAVGDSVWDMLAARRAGCLGVGILSGGVSGADLASAHAFRVYEDLPDMLRHSSELGVQSLT